MHGATLKMGRVIWLQITTIFWLGGETIFFFQLLKVHGVNDVRHMEIHTAEPLVPEPSALEVEMATEMLKRHKSPGVDQIPAKLIKAGVKRICSKIHELINSIWNREELPEGWKESIIVLIYKGDNTDSSNYRGTSLCQLHKKLHPTSCCQY
jgi:3-oxoacyl-ACP reductase-like protein